MLRLASMIPQTQTWQARLKLLRCGWPAPAMTASERSCQAFKRYDSALGTFPENLQWIGFKAISNVNQGGPDSEAMQRGLSKLRTGRGSRE